MTEPESSRERQPASPITPVEEQTGGVKEAAHGEDEKDREDVEGRERRWHWHLHRHHTISPEDWEHAETRGAPRKYVFGRPRALQYTYHEQVISNVTRDEEMAFRHSARPDLSLSRESSVDFRGPGDAESIAKSRERMDLFIDLIWVGIISNLSEVYSVLYFDPEKAAGTAALVFIITFTASWRIWNTLREFMSNYYMDDMLQRVFTFWILVLSVFYGNNLAYLPEDIETMKVKIITLYLFIRGSFSIMEAVYSFYIPWLRRLVLLHVILILPSIGFWIGGIYVDGIRAVGPIIAALLWEYFIPTVLDSRLSSKLTPSQYRKAVDPDHIRSRFASFFILTVGEGVLQLVSRGPLGIGITATAAVSVWALSIYFVLAFVYFNRAQSKYFISAVRRGGRYLMAWIFWHIPLFACFLTLSSSIMFMLRHQALIPENVDQNDEKIPEDKIEYYMYASMWSMSTSLTVILLSNTILALLDKPLDPPKTLLVNNRYARLSGRLIYSMVILTVPATKHLSVDLYLGIASIMMSFLIAAEWIMSLERGGGLLEPRGLTAILSSRRRAHKHTSRDRSKHPVNAEGA